MSLDYIAQREDSLSIIIHHIVINMRNFQIAVIAVTSLILLFACTKETKVPSIRLTRITSTDYTDSKVVAEYQYNSENQLVKVIYPDCEETFMYFPDGKLSEYKNSKEHNMNYTFRYSGEQLEYALILQTGMPYTGYDTIYYSYDSRGFISGITFNHCKDCFFEEIQCDDQGRVIRGIKTVYANDTAWYQWDATGNLTSRRLKSRNYENGGYDVFIDTYQYSTALNIFNAVPYPETWLFIRSLMPSPHLSANFYAGDCYSCLSWPLEHRSCSVVETNEHNYPVRLIYKYPEIQYTLEYEEY